MFDMLWVGKYGDYFIVCEMCNMMSIWFRFVYILLENVFLEGDMLVRKDIVVLLGIGGLFSIGLSGKVVLS